MCLMVYVATQRPIKERPLNTGEPGFGVALLDREYDRAVQSQFSLPEVISVCGLHCGCGFITPLEDGDARPHPREVLVEFLRPIVEAGEPVEIYSSWDGDQDLPVEKTNEFDLAGLISSPEAFQERQLMTVRSSRAV